MSESDALQWVTQYGPLALAVLMFANRFGIPTAAPFVMMAMGGLVHAGGFAMLPVLACLLIGDVAGDVSAYLIAGRGLARLLRRYEKHTLVSAAQTALARYGKLAVFLSRFLLLPLMVPINVVAPYAPVRLLPFFLLSVAGNSMYIALYFGIGYLFGGSFQAVWNAVLALLPEPWFWATLVALGIGGALIWRCYRQMWSHDLQEQEE